MGETQPGRKPLDFLHEVTRRFFRAETPDQVASHAVKTAREQLDFTEASLWFYDEDRTALALADGSDPANRFPDASRDESPRHSRGSWVWEQIDGDESVTVQSPPEEWPHPGISPASSLLIPLDDHGLLSCGTRDGATVDACRRRQAEILARNASAALEQIEENRQLSNLKKQYETVFTHSQDALFLVDLVSEKRLEFVRFNAREEELTGIPTEEIAGCSPVEAFGEELGREVEANYWRCVEAEEPISYQEQLEFPNGNEYDFHTKLAPVKSDGKVQQIVGVARDITEQKRMQQKIRRENRRLETVIETREKILESELDLEEIIGIVLDHTLRACDADAGVYDALSGSKRSDLTLWSTRGEEMDPSPEPLLQDLCRERDRIVVSDDLGEDPRFDRPDYFRRVNYRSGMAVSIQYEDRVFGVLEVFSHDAGVFGDEHRRALDLMAGLLAGSLFNAAQFSEINSLLEQTRKLARTDSLTGLSNRKHLFELLEREVERAGRYDREFCFAVLDLDRFKRVNDEYGHQAGDEVLRRVADLLSDSIRSTDQMGRYGGEEFGILLPETDREEARSVCERVRTSLKERSFPLENGEEMNITCSIGVAQWQPDDTDLDQLVRRADDALYAAKRRGRDRVLTRESGE